MVFVRWHIPSRKRTEFKIPSNIIAYEINPRKENFHEFTKLHLRVKEISFPFDKSITALLKLLRKGLNFWWFYPRGGKLGNEGFPSGADVMQCDEPNTCFEGNKSSCIDLLITNSKFSFMKTHSRSLSLVWVISIWWFLLFSK